MSSSNDPEDKFSHVTTPSLAERQKQVKERMERTIRETKEWTEFLKDATFHFDRLTKFEQEFLHSMAALKISFKVTRKEELTWKQVQVVEQIEEKVYAVG